MPSFEKSPVSKALGYVRVSRYRDDSQLSPESQRQRLEHFAADKGLVLKDIYSDLDVSGASFSRPGWDELISSVQSSEVIICLDYTRLGRNLRQTLERIEELSQRGVEVISIMEPLDTTTAAGRLQLNILLTLAQFQRERVREQAIQTHMYLAREGRHRGGILALGLAYKAPSEGDYTIIVDDHTAEAVRLMFELRDSGHGIKSIVHELNSKGYRGKLNGKPFLPSTIRQTLRCRTYIAERDYRGTVYPINNIPALIDRDLWERVQAMDVRDSGSRAPLHLLTGLLKCAKCSGGLSYHKGSYMCRQVRTGGDCKGVYISAPYAERLVTEGLFKRVETLGYREATRASSPKAKKTAPLESRISGLETKQDRLLNTYLERKVDPSVFERNSKQLSQELAALRSELSKLEAVHKLPPAFLGDIRADWELFTLDEKREALKRFIERGTVKPGRGPNRLQIEWI